MRSITMRFLLPFGLMALGLVAFVEYRAYQEDMREHAEHVGRQASLAVAFNVALRDYMAQEVRPVLESAPGPDAFDPQTICTSRISRNVFEEVRKKFPEATIRFCSGNPRNPANRATPAELRMIEHFQRNPDARQTTAEIEMSGERRMACFVPRLITESCLRCHGDPKDAPAELVAQYGNSAGFGRKVGDVAGVDMVSISLDGLDAAARDYLVRNSATLLVGLCVLVGLVMLLFNRVVIRRLRGMAGHMHIIASQPASTAMAPLAVQSTDEVGMLASAFNRLVERVRCEQDSLECRVADRTADLTLANDSLSKEIAERQRVEAALRASEARFRSIVSVAQDAIVMMDEKGCISFWNSSAERMFGYTAAEAVGRDLHQLLAPARYHEAFHRNMPAFARTGQGTAVGKVVELVGRRRDGSEMPVELSIAPMQLGDNWHAVGILRDVSQRKAMEDQLRLAARTDPLTGLPNRSLLLDRLRNAIASVSQSSDRCFSVLFIDLDRFKTVNDSLGHDVGDQLLQEVAGRLLRAVTDGSGPRRAGSSIAARLGGDEFVVVLDGVGNAADAARFADRLLEQLGRPLSLCGFDIGVAASIGIVTPDSTHERAEDILRDADIAVYEAKLAGKGCAMVFDQSMRERARRRLELEQGLRRGIGTDQFHLHYQPIICLETGQVEGFEALLRWQPPERGPVTPAEFIPVAEETGLIVPLGEWVFGQACRQLAQWQRTSGAEGINSVNVNLSRNQLALPGLAQKLHRIAVREGHDPSAVHIEVTESAIMRDAKHAAAALHEIREAGFKVDMDDFGTGYSSLACLHQFPIDVLKIDKSFIANLNRGRDFAALVSAIALLARNLGIRVVAEGVEHPDQVSMLQALECHAAQGYYFARPMPADGVVEFVRQRRAKAA